MAMFDLIDVSEPEQLGHLGVLRLESGDVLAFALEPGRHASWGDIERIRANLTEGFPGHRVLIMDGGTLGVVRKAEPVKLIIEPDGDEVIRYTLEASGGSTLLIDANHDDDGWAGMDRIRDALTKLAKGVGVEIEDRT